MVLKSKNWIIVILVSFTKLAQITTILKKTMMENVRGIYFNQKNSKSSKNQIDVELEIHTTCLDDSCCLCMNIIFLNLKEEWIVGG